jgi:hypothetical protein
MLVGRNQRLRNMREVQYLCRLIVELGGLQKLHRLALKKNLLY